MRKFKLPKYGSKRMDALIIIGTQPQGFVPKNHPTLRSMLYGKSGLLRKYCVKHESAYFFSPETYNAMTQHPVINSLKYYYRPNTSILSPIKVKDLSIENQEKIPDMPNPLLVEIKKLKNLRQEESDLRKDREEIDSNLADVRQKIKLQERHLKNLIGLE